MAWRSTVASAASSRRRQARVSASAHVPIRVRGTTVPLDDRGTSDLNSSARKLPYVLSSAVPFPGVLRRPGSRGPWSMLRESFPVAEAGSPAPTTGATRRSSPSTAQSHQSRAWITGRRAGAGGEQHRHGCRRPRLKAKVRLSLPSLLHGEEAPSSVDLSTSTAATSASRSCRERSFEAYAKNPSSSVARERRRLRVAPFTLSRPPRTGGKSAGCCRRTSTPSLDLAFTRRDDRNVTSISRALHQQPHPGLKERLGGASSSLQSPICWSSCRTGRRHAVRIHPRHDPRRSRSSLAPRGVLSSAVSTEDERTSTTVTAYGTRITT